MRGRPTRSLPHRSGSARRLALGLALALAALAGCSGEGEPQASPAAGRSAAPVDAFTALAPPTARVGALDPIVSQRAFEKARGLLALSLAEAGTLTGTTSGTAALLEQLRVPDDDLSVAGLLRPRPTAKALGVRPLFAPTVSLGRDAVEVVRSTYRGEEVRGLGGESGVRVTWDGSVRYRVVVQGRPQEVAYALSVAYVFGPVPDEAIGLQLVQVVPGAFHAAPVVTSCLAKGLLLPGTGTPTPGDYGVGPWPAAEPGPACPL